MIKDFVIWDKKREKDACFLGPLQEVDNVQDFKTGIAQDVGFPKSAYLRMDSNNDGTKLPDRVRNADDLIIISSALAEFFMDVDVTHVEFLPVSIQDHKGKVVADNYFIFHPINHVGCLDAEKSGASWNDQMEITKVRSIVVDEGRMDSSRIVFRFDQFYLPLLIRRDIADKMLAHGFTGSRFLEVKKFKS